MMLCLVLRATTTSLQLLIINTKFTLLVIQPHINKRMVSSFTVVSSPSSPLPPMSSVHYLSTSSESTDIQQTTQNKCRPGESHCLPKTIYWDGGHRMWAQCDFCLALNVNVKKFCTLLLTPHPHPR